ncbi:transposase [Undibacterium luofuense]|uniref:Transposase n=1 Tax=Undibacterium luofuense TaxID=2828733 RepID=A0A941I7P4_9BURK|nr:transposase [Undibacterium luofuense]MBR7784046.1 transposase [Undibacterium luofuense]
MMDDEINTPRRRRRHSAEFKAQVIQACKQPGISIAATVLRYQLNANQVRIWMKAHEQLAIPSTPIAPITKTPEFIPIPLPAPTAVTATPDIVIDIRRGAAHVTVRLPQAAAAECAGWLQNWLR